MEQRTKPSHAKVQSLDGTNHPNRTPGDTDMRNLLLAAAVAFTAVASFAAPSQAGSYSYGYEPYCVVKKIKTYDYYGNLIVKRVRVCH
jgi:hypothetical protein